MRHVKGVDVLVEAARAVSDPACDLYSQGIRSFGLPVRHDVLERARVLGVRGHIDVIGGQSQEALARLMSESAVQAQTVAVRWRRNDPDGVSRTRQAGKAQPARLR